MKKLLMIVIGCILFLQACKLDDENDAKMQMKGEVTMSEQLIYMTEQGETNEVSRLVMEDVDINAQDSIGRTAVMIATYNEDVETVKVLLDAGADVNIQDDMKNSPFLYAGAEGYLEILRLTIDAGANPAITNRYGGTALIPASEHGYVEVVEELLTRTPIDVNHINNLNWTALMEAVILNNGNKKQQETIRLLIKHGADVNIPDKNNITPLQHARIKGFNEIAELLIEAGAK